MAPTRHELATEAGGDAAIGAAAQPGVWTIALAGLSVIGLGLLWWQFGELYALWTTDSLRSIGVLVIPASVGLGWRLLGREDFRAGSIWGLLPMALALAGTNLRFYGSPVLQLFGEIGPGLLSSGLLLCLYASGAVILLGGFATWRKAAFPLLLVLFVNPMPSFFTALVDLPLQRFDAQVARDFAAWLQIPVTGSTLNLLFYRNEMGMFIAPGCDGLRGTAAMGLLAAVIGHLRGLRAGGELLLIAAAVALAYLFNLFRLCALVLYYRLAHSWPLLGAHAVGADYLIGAVLFALAAAFLFRVPSSRRSG